MKTTRYTVTVICSNCGYSGTKDMLKGIRVENSDCPNCECVTLKLKPVVTYQNANIPIDVSADLSKTFDKLNGVFDELGKTLDKLFK